MSYKKYLLNSSKINKIIEQSFEDLKSIDSEIQIKYSNKIILIGDRSIDSVSLLNLLLLIEEKLKKEYKINFSLLELDLFSSNKTVTISDLIKSIERL